MHLIPTKKVDKSPGNHLLYHYWKINLKMLPKLAVKIQIIATVGPHTLNHEPARKKILKTLLTVSSKKTNQGGQGGNYSRWVLCYLTFVQPYCV